MEGDLQTGNDKIEDKTGETGETETVKENTGATSDSQEPSKSNCADASVNKSDAKPKVDKKKLEQKVDDQDQLTDEDDKELAAIEDNLSRLRVSTKKRGKKGKENAKDVEGDGKCVQGDPTGLPTKVAFRNLPPSLSEEEFLQVISPEEDEFDYFTYCYADKFYGAEASASAHMNFLEPETADLFIERFNGYIIVDHSGFEWQMSAEFSQYQGVPKRSTKIDPFMDTIEDDEDYQEFCKMYDENNDGVIGVKPVYGDTKTMQEHFLKELDEKEARKGQLQLTPLLEAIQARMRKDRAKLMKEREEQAARKKENERQRMLRKERRREKREQERKERQRVRRERREKEDRERRERKSKKEQETPGKSSSGKNDNEAEPKKQDAVKNTTEDVKAKAENVSRNSKPAVNPKDSHRTDKPENVKKPDYKSNSRGVRRDRYTNENVRSGNQRRDANDYKNPVDRTNQNYQKKDRAKQGSSTVLTSSSTNGKSDEKDKQKEKEPTPSNSTKEPESATATSNVSESDTKSAESNSQAKKRVVKKIVKVVRVKSGETVPAEGKVVDKTKPIRKEEAKDKSLDLKKETKSEEKLSISSASDKESNFKSADRLKKARPDIQIYRPGSWRQNASGGSSGSRNHNSNNSDKHVKKNNEPSKTTTIRESGNGSSEKTATSNEGLPKD